MMKIVIVEDEIRIREGIANLIQKIGKEYEITGIAKNGIEGLDIIRSKNPDLVIMDIRMPEMDGLEMLSQLKQQGVQVKAIVLSDYSEFSYAQKAIKLGVSEYLIKPIAIGELTQALKNIENQLKQEQKNQADHPEMLRSLENVFSNILLGEMPINQELSSFLSRVYQIDAEMDFVAVLNYMGDQYEQEAGKLKGRLCSILNERAALDYCMLELPKIRESLVVLYHFDDSHGLERWFQNTVLPQVHKEISGGLAVGWIFFRGIANMKASVNILQKHMDWNIILGDEIMVSYPKVTQIQTVPLTYPIEIENRMRVALCSMDIPRLKKENQAFQEYFRKDNLYSPKEVKECYVRFLWTMINVAKEIDFVQFQGLEQQVLLENIMSAVTERELKKTLCFLMDRVTDEAGEEPPSANIMIQRAKSLVHEFYNQGITLDEIAAKLNVSPEYLSTQFHKEIGTNFSAYIKNFRIKKAKELLLGTDLKLYQISEKVGYGDPKHFSKVFREFTGQIPAEYRKIYK